MDNGSIDTLQAAIDMETVIADTGLVVALTNRSNIRHTEVRTLYAPMPAPSITPDGFG
ncbi:MAG: hypothetical protein HC792_01285 [Acaryochloridaceae cyanobacterium CSU_5_19]|nr:hypothetical protein [Acaryochloridaceae cyanobacterium CSU_5_19]